MIISLLSNVCLYAESCLRSHWYRSNGFNCSGKSFQLQFCDRVFAIYVDRVPCKWLLSFAFVLIHCFQAHNLWGSTAYMPCWQCATLPATFRSKSPHGHVPLTTDDVSTAQVRVNSAQATCQLTPSFSKLATIYIHLHILLDRHLLSAHCWLPFM